MVKISSIFFVASECWTLSRFLPLLIGDLVPEDDNHWQLFLLLLKIVNFVMSPRSTHDIAAYTRDLIAEHHTSFNSLTSVDVFRRQNGRQNFFDKLVIKVL